MRLPAIISLLLLASCVADPQRTAAVNPQLLAACKANYKSHDWQLAEPPPAATRNVYSVPKDATTQLWFRGRDRAYAVCTPCGAGSVAGASAVRSFEWYGAGFKEGELNLKNCGAKR